MTYVLYAVTESEFTSSMYGWLTSCMQWPPVCLAWTWRWPRTGSGGGWSRWWVRRRTRPREWTWTCPPSCRCCRRSTVAPCSRRSGSPHTSAADKQQQETRRLDRNKWGSKTTLFNETRQYNKIIFLQWRTKIKATEINNWNTYLNPGGYNLGFKRMLLG